jgi:NADH-quinone oxidoreductase subunit M
MILTFIIFIPAIGGILAWIAARWSVNTARWLALLACAVDLALAASIGVRHSGFPTQVAPWIPQFGVSYHLAMDGLSLLLVLLTGLLGIMAVASSWREIHDRVGGFLLALMLLLTGILGVFLAFDLFLFYFFWELMIVPMYFLIGIWGHENRVYAAIKFFLFTFISGLFMLISIIGLYFVHGRATGNYTFDYNALLASRVSGPFAFWLMLGFFIAFAVKLPMFGLHTWLPDAHTQAPTAGSVILAGLMLKTGAYGLLRFAVPLFPEASAALAPVATALGAAGIIYGAMLAFAQTDFKRMVAYTSVSHMGFVLVGIYIGSELALQGAVMEMLSHGIATGALFLLVGMVQERTGTRDLRSLGGLWSTAPRLGGFVLLFGLAAMGLPGFGNFVGEFLVLIGAYQVSPVISIVSTLGFVFSVIYAVKLIQASVLGPNNHEWALPELTIRETTMLAVLAATILILGLYPQPIFNAAIIASRWSVVGGR